MCTQSSWPSPGPRARSARLVWFVLTALDVEHETAEAVAIRLQRFEDRVGDQRELVSTKTRRYQDDPRVLRIGRDGILVSAEVTHDFPHAQTSSTNLRRPTARFISEVNAWAVPHSKRLIEQLLRDVCDRSTISRSRRLQVLA